MICNFYEFSKWKLLRLLKSFIQLGLKLKCDKINNKLIIVKKEENLMKFFRDTLMEVQGHFKEKEAIGIHE